MSSPAEVMVGVDVGTTAVKVAAFDVHGEPGQLPAQREYPLQQPEPGWRVQNPLTVLAAVDAAGAECVSLLENAQVLALSLSTAMHGLIGLDSQLRPSTPLVAWADSRAGEQARELRRDGRALELLQLTGTPVHPMSPLGTPDDVATYGSLRAGVPTRIATYDRVAEMFTPAGTRR